MAYDEQLAGRVRELMEPRSGVVEKKMFGGLAWMVDGNMAVGASSRGALIVRMVPEDVAAALREPHVQTFGHEGKKPMSGFVVVDAPALEEDAELERWVDVGANRAASLPPK